MRAAGLPTGHAAPYRCTDDPPQRWPLSALVIAAVLVVGAAMTWFAWRDALADERAATQRALNARATQIVTALKDRMLAYEALLYAGVGLFESSEDVSSEEWRAFALNLRAASLYPGLQGFGFARRVESSAVGDPSERDHTSIVYLEPRTERNLAAVGFDMMSEPVRRRAMERARDHGQAALSGKVTLMQEITADKQAGFLLYLPVYESGARPRAVAERRRALIGYVYCPFRANDLLTAALGRLSENLHLEVFDAPEEGVPDLLFASAAPAEAQLPADSRAFQLTRTLEVMGRTWLLRIQPLPALLEARRNADAPRILLIGASGTLLLAGLVWALGRSRYRLARQLHAERLASQRERHAAEILDNSLDGYIAIDGDDRVVEWNRQAEGMFGWTQEEMRGARLVDTIIPERHRQAHLAAVRSFAVRGVHALVGRRIEMPALRRDRQEITVELSILATTRGEEPLYVASLRDVTELKRHEAEILALNASLEHRVAQRTEQLADANRDLRLANEQLEAFARNVSHDLRSPLRTIEGFARVAMEESGTAPAAALEARLSSVVRYARKMQQIIDDLLKLAFIGRQPVQKRPVNLRSLVLGMLADLTAHSKVAIIVSDELGEALADPGLLEHALRNLLSNAVKFSRAVREPRVEIGVAIQHGERVYFVRDNGVGFRKEQADELFRAFHRLHRDDGFEGAGVGLTIVKSVIEKHGGRVWADAESGAGATFYFTLPER